MIVSIPRANTNEDQVVIADVAVMEGQRVKQGDLLCVVETTKAAVEVSAPAAGVVSQLHAGIGEVIDVGAKFCDLETASDISVQAQKGLESSSSAPRITAKARKRAHELGLDPESLPNDALVDVKFVERLALQNKVSDNAVTFSYEFIVDADSPAAIINGGSGHAAVVIDALRGSGIRIIGAVDSIKAIGAQVLHGVAVIGREDMLAQVLGEGVRLAFVGVGGADNNLPRQKVYKRLKSQGFELPPIIHPKAYVGEGVEIGEGSLVLAGAVIGPRCRIGANVIVNQGSQICHDSIIGDHCHIAPGAIVAGYCEIGDYTVVGMAATVLDHTRIGRDCLIHNGAAVVYNLPDAIVLARDGRIFEQKRR